MEELANEEPSTSSQRLAPSLPFLFSAIELLPELLFEREPNADFCKTPVGEEPNCGLPSQPSVIRLSAADEFLIVAKLLLVLVKTSPKGPPIELPQEIGGTMLFRFLLSSPMSLFSLKPICIAGSNSRDNLSGERASFSCVGEDVDDENSEDGIGIDIESWVQSDFSSSCQVITE